MQPETKSELIAILREMAEADASCAGSYEATLERSMKLRAFLQSSALCSVVPEFVWHFLSDVDLWKKDPEYGGFMRKQLRALLATGELE